LDNQQPSPKGKVQRLGFQAHECTGRVGHQRFLLAFCLKKKGDTFDRKMEAKYIQSIVSIRDKKTQTNLSWKLLSIEKVFAKFSNTKTPIYKLIIDNKAISRNNSLVVKYKCLTCEVQQEISLNLFMRKVNQEGSRCVSCRNLEDGKREKQSLFMKENASNIIAGEYEKKEKKKLKELSLENHLQKSQEDWEIEDDDFKDSFFHIHLTGEDFKRIRSKIINIGNGKVCDLSGWSYEPCYRVFNQTKYTPMLVNMNANQVEKPLYISFICENCDCKFTHRDLETVKNKIKIFCKDCSFTNKTFRIRKMLLKNGESICWQSIFEKRFIEWCDSNNIAIKNGPNISYFFQEKRRTYRVDFELPQHRQLVEIKDNHCWHKEQVENGKFSAKEKSAIEWAKENGYTYQVVFPKTLADFKKQLLPTTL
jgi:hypothetical protein